MCFLLSGCWKRVAYNAAFNNNFILTLSSLNSLLSSSYTTIFLTPLLMPVNYTVDCLLFIVYCLFDFQLKTCKNGTLSLLLIGYFFNMLFTLVDGNRSRRPLQCLSAILVN